MIILPLQISGRRAFNLSSKSYLRGLSETLEVLTSDDPEAWERYFNRQIGSRVVPYSSMLRTVNPDKELKELRSVTDGILTNVPGLSELVEPRRNVLGQPMLAGNPFVSEKTSSVVKEELNFLGEEFGLPPKRFPQTRVDLTNYRKEGEFGQTAYDRYQELAGSIKINGKTMEQTLEDLIKSPVYQRFPALETEPSFRSKRSDLISARILTYRNLAMRQLRKEYPEMDQDIRTDQRNAKVAPVKGTSAIQGILQEAQ